MKKKLLFLSIFVSVLCLFSCNRVEPVVIEEPVKEEDPEPEETKPASWYYVLGGQQENGFKLWIFIRQTEEETLARVISGTGAINKDPFITDDFDGCDFEILTYNDNENGFTLSDPDTGEVCYTVHTLFDNPFEPNFIYYRVSWTHSPGAIWDENAQEKGWQNEMNLYSQIQQMD